MDGRAEAVGFADMLFVGVPTAGFWAAIEQAAGLRHGHEADPG